MNLVDKEDGCACRREARHCVHGAWMTEREAAKRLGRPLRTIRNWRHRNRRANGKPGLLEVAYDHYDAINRGRIPRHNGGRKPVRFPYRGRLMTIKQAAMEMGIDEKRIYNTMEYNGLGLAEAIERIDRRRIKKAVAEVMGIIYGGAEHGRKGEGKAKGAGKAADACGTEAGEGVRQRMG